MLITKLKFLKIVLVESKANTKTLFHSDCFALQLLPIVWNGSQISKDDKEARFIFLHRWSLITKARLRTKAFVLFDKEAQRKKVKREAL